MLSSGLAPSIVVFRYTGAVSHMGLGGPCLPYLTLNDFPLD